MIGADAGRPLLLLSVFAEAPLEGNALAVVLEAGGLSDELQGRLARELRMAETVFVQPPGIAGADYRSRIWTVVEEVPFAGHPTLGTAVAVTLSAGRRAAAYVQETATGTQRVRVREDGAAWSAAMDLPASREGPEVPLDAALAVLRLPREARPRGMEARFASAGLETLLVPLASREWLAAARPERRAIAALGPAGAMFNLYAFAVDAGRGRAWARSFSSRPEEEEDPATGSAAAPLGAYLERRLGLRRVMVEQGLEAGHPSRIDVEVTGRGITVGGRVRLVARGRLAPLG